jgi:hypothetical protein
MEIYIMESKKLLFGTLLPLLLNVTMASSAISEDDSCPAAASSSIPQKNPREAIAQIRAEHAQKRAKHSGKTPMTISKEQLALDASRLAVAQERLALAEERLAIEKESEAWKAAQQAANVETDWKEQLAIARKDQAFFDAQLMTISKEQQALDASRLAVAKERLTLAEERLALAKESQAWKAAQQAANVETEIGEIQEQLRKAAAIDLPQDRHTEARGIFEAALDALERLRKKTNSK